MERNINGKKTIRIDRNKGDSYMNSKISEMAGKGFRLISTTVIPSTGSIPDGHGGDYGNNEQFLMIFQK